MAIKHKDIAAIREDYTKFALSENEIDKNPLRQFEIWFRQAVQAEVMEPNAMVLGTVTKDGFPRSRIVLMKDINEDGLSFFTNYESAKSIAIENNPKVSVLFFWPELQRQVCIEAYAEKLGDEASTEYFQSRPRDSQVGAWSSPQSKVISDRTILEERVEAIKKQYDGVDVLPRPDFWGGFLLKPVKFEFWQGRASRLHDRIEYINSDDNWIIRRLAP